ncbi:MAG: hypothetical protein AYK18_14340 [Theionarchaea archaeon DG-70]|nr:MAG: hypothetical protein AYK18_14340 [Theionarchaea archaeon DG-70]
MQISERRKKILDTFLERDLLSYKEILDETSWLGDPIDILSDLDTLVFFAFLQHVRYKKPEPEITTQLELRQRTKTQMKDNPQRILSRLRELEREFPPWYRKLAILKILNNQRLNCEEIEKRVNDQCPHEGWSSPLIQASLRALEKARYVFTTIDYKRCTLTSEGKELLEKFPFLQFVCLKHLKNEFTIEFRTYVILELVRDRHESGITSGSITQQLQEKYGIRGNRRNAVKNTLENMVIAGMLRVSGGTSKRRGHVYFLSKTAESLFLPSNDL